MLIFLCGDVHINPGPQPDKIKILHWNVNSIKTDNFSRVTLIHSFNMINHYDIIAISETGLHDDDSSDDLTIDGFSLYRRDLPPDETHGGVMVYVNENLSCNVRNDLETDNNQLILELFIEIKKVFVSTNYRKHHANSTQLEDFMEKM